MRVLKKIAIVLSVLSVLTSACTTRKVIIQVKLKTVNTPKFAKSVYHSWTETFENANKGAYAPATITLSTGSWYFNNALIGSFANDRKNGAQAVRMQSTGDITMQFDLTNGASQVDIQHAVYGTDASSTWELWYSTNSGSTWIKTGNTITTSSMSLSNASFVMNIKGNVRFQLRKLGGGRLNIDDFSVTDNLADGATRDDNMALGNPSGATADVVNTNNFLMVKTQYALAYDNSRGTANWVSWHLSTAWKRTATRCDCFAGDNTLPTGYYKAYSSHYTNSGFDRGHICPSDDRDGSAADNAATFLMTNIMPQAPNLNQITWAALETYCRTLINAGNELYIISGGYGSRGTGSNGTFSTIYNGFITVPSHYWKVVVVLPNGSNDLSRVSTSTRVIAVDMPNVQTVNSQTWGYYRTSVDVIEAATGYNFLSNVPANIQAVIEAAVDNGPIQ